MTRHPAAELDLLTPAAVAAALFVDPKTVTRWARAGKIRAILTPGGHHRFHRADVVAFMEGQDHDPLRQRIPGLEESRPGSAAAAAAATVAEARAIRLQDRADAAARAVSVAASSLATATADAAEAAATARRGRAVANVHAAHARHA